MEGAVGRATVAESRFRAASRCFMETQKVRKRSEDACGACWSLVSSFTSFSVPLLQVDHDAPRSLNKISVRIGSIVA